MALFVVHYSEVALKGRNRPEFVRALRRNVRVALAGLDPDVRFRDGRILVESGAGSEEIRRRLSRVFGVAWFAEAVMAPADYGALETAVLQAADNPDWESFKIEPRRSDKSTSLSSHELAVRLGSAVSEKTSKRVDLSDPDLTIHVDMLKEKALVYTLKVRGPGGLPVGTAGKVIHLFSGGIDSPVAAWLLMKRGCRPIYLHFYASSGTSPATDGKIARLVRLLSAYSGRSVLVLVPFDEYQLATLGVPGELEPSLFRRFMRITSELLAPRFGASGISTGDSLSQAASQTLWNLGGFDDGSTLPILRPLLTYDKEEIVSLAREIGTYETSLEQYKDCCAMVTRHPRTRAKSASISEYAEALKFEQLASKSLQQATLVTYKPSTGETRSTPLTESLAREQTKVLEP